MARVHRIVLELRAGPLAEPDVSVRRVVGREGLSTPYAFDVDFLPASGEPLELSDLVGAEALLTLRRPQGSERNVHGLLQSVEMVEVAAGKPRYRARLAPRLVRLGLVRRSRIFQSMSVPDIVKKVLDEGEVKHRESLADSYPPREYCVQYRETDLAFVSRLLEEEGIFYFFEHGTDEHVMVLADAGGGCVELAGDGTVPFRGVARVGAEAEEEEHLTELERARRLRTGKVSLRDFDFERPELKVEGQCEADGDAFKLECYEYPGGFRDGGAGSRLSRVRLEELRFGVETFAGAGTCLRFLPGATFETAEHADAAMNRKLLLARVEHEAWQRGGEEAIDQGYRNAFAALDAGVPYRPLRRTRRPRALAETALVVGPSGEEIHPDKHGRVKVKFHWDREGKADEKASCWIRCAQAWAGPAWGASFVPRIGQEVVVRFLEGDPDRPLVVGAVYNGANPPPIALPDDKTRSTLRTDSSPGSGGANELRFEDLKGAEEIHLHAQKDETIEVLNDKRQEVRANESLEVGKDRSQEIRGNQSLEVTAEDGTSVGSSQTLTVIGTRTTRVGASHQETVALAQVVNVGGNRDITVGATAAETVAAAAALNVGGVYAVNVGAAMNKAVGGLFSGQVGGARVEVVGATRGEVVGKDSEAQVAGDFDEEVGGTVGLDTGKDQNEEVAGAVEIEVRKPVAWSAKEFKLEADKLSVVVDGKVALSIDTSGNVTFGANNFSVEGNTLTLKGSQVTKSASGTAASASPKVTQLKPMPGDKAFVEINLQDKDGNPVANEWFKVEFPDGTVKEGRTGGSGKAWVPGPKEGNVKVSFPALVEGKWKKA